MLNIRYQVHMLNVKKMILSVIAAYSVISQSSHQLLPYFQAPHSPAILCEKSVTTISMASNV
jgi:hypothetical protein